MGDRRAEQLSTSREATEALGVGPIVERLLELATRDVQLLATLTPSNARAERERMVAYARAGQPTMPRWTYAPVTHDELRRALDDAAQTLEQHAAGPIEQLHLDRLRELSVEAALCAAVGSERVGALADARFRPRDADVERAASVLGASWLSGSDDAAPGPLRLSDAADPRSLLARMRAAVGRARLPFAVVTHPSLAPLAATGDRVILVATGRLVSDEDVERTVLHEIEGHARPRARALQSPLAVCRVGTARGVDDQEGRALLLEERAGLLTPRRRRALAARHRAFEAMVAGATFADVVVRLMRDHGLEPHQAVLFAERVFRGSHGVRPGLGRERVYLEGLLRVRAHLDACPQDEPVLAGGQIAVGAAEALRAYVS